MCIARKRHIKNLSETSRFQTEKLKYTPCSCLQGRPPLRYSTPRFKIGHTLRKFPCTPQATFRFIAYHLQSRTMYYNTFFLYLQGIVEILYREFQEISGDIFVYIAQYLDCRSDFLLLFTLPAVMGLNCLNYCFHLH